MEQQWSSNDGTNEVPSSSSSYMANTERGVNWKVDAPEFVPKKATQQSSSQTSVNKVKLHDSQAGEAKTESDQTADKSHKADQRPEKVNEIAADTKKKVDCRFCCL